MNSGAEGFDVDWAETNPKITTLEVNRIMISSVGKDLVLVFMRAFRCNFNKRFLVQVS